MNDSNLPSEGKKKIRRADALAKRLELQAHPEGGYYAEYFRAAADHPAGSHSLAYFLLGEGDKSHFHRLKQSEWWIYHDGAPLQLYTIDSLGNLTTRMLGPSKGTSFSLLIEGGTWMAAKSLGDHTLFTCLVTPAFEFADFELGSRMSLLQQYPQHREMIEEFAL